MAADECVSVLLNASDRNLVVNKGACFVKSEINDLHFVVHPTSQHICRISLSLLKQRRNYKKKHGDLILNHNLLRQYREKAGAKGLAVKPKVTAKRSLLVADEGEVPSTSSGHRSNCEDESTTRSSTAIHFQPTSTSTSDPLPKPQYEVEKCLTANHIE